ncbi:ribosomal silencing factor RsfS [Oxobacter pfennigii]|uniref:Ribosomal silencing factor RsfS n=1 Tax=Oxobacter pfennigii TaxID=36849 RepID=A0A0P8WNN2_9CLOT|nr:ribosome silencing factor [Oxobacter pfennigii]KPU44158.1 ribosomal silencing factor RsfS [Oxobacter pfennigii]
MLDDSKALILHACNAGENKKAKDIKVLDISSISPITDYFVLFSGSSTVQVRAIADEVEEKLTEKGYALLHKEGYNASRWILLDFGDVIVHVFHEEDREFYNLERLWADADVINF